MSKIFFILTLLIFACQPDEEMVNPPNDPGYKIGPIEDPKIKAEIIAMATGRAESKNGKTSVIPPGGVTLPSGYDYANAHQVTFSGMPGIVTYVAFSTTWNMPDSKKVVGIYYQNGVYKNYMKVLWNYTNVHEERAMVKYYLPGGYVDVWITPTAITRNYALKPPDVCGDEVAQCINDLYTEHGWESVGLWLASLIDPVDIPVAVVAYCMVDCAICEECVE